ncbi:MAG: hypothetical protein JWP58_4381 [Hymenobacter sp.]|nr:hypothetical protein [Hymenobacter sp.]
MKSSTLTHLLLAPLLAATVLGSCGKKTVEPEAPTSSFAIQLEPVVGPADLELKTKTYTKADGQAFTVSTFMLMLSNVKLTRADGSAYAVPDGYYLFNAADPQSYQILIDKVPLGDYTGISFVVGVDDAHNNATAKGGALVHTNAMYWEWGGEYVFLSLAGTSPQAPASSGHLLTYDINGSKSVRVVSPAFDKGVVLPVVAGHVPAIHMSVDVQHLFESATPAKNINFATTYIVDTSSPWNQVMADNYAAGMFTVEHIHAN